MQQQQQLLFPFPEIEKNMNTEKNNPQNNSEIPEVIMVPKKDLEKVILLIDVIASRGAFKGNELMDVGYFRNNIEKLIKGDQKTENTVS